MKTSELTNEALDWAVAKCEGEEVSLIKGKLETRWTDNGWKPSTDWSQGGPIIEREGITVGDAESSWVAGKPWADEFLSAFVVYGPTPLIAAMRCYCCSKLGDEVEIPKELL